MSRILAVDPGPESSGAVLLDAEWPPRVIKYDRTADIKRVMQLISSSPPADAVVCEWLTSYGSCVGATTFDTARAVGRIEERCYLVAVPFYRLTRPEVAMELCQARSAKDSQISEAIRSIYREAGLATGGGADPCRGTKANPGPLYGMALSNHEGSALAVGVAWLRMRTEGRL